MNASVLKEGNNAMGVAIASAIVAGTIGFIGGQYNNNSSALSAEMLSHDRSIEHLTVRLTDDESGMARIESTASAAQINVNALVSQIGALKTALDAQTEGFHALQKQVGDMDHWLRPDPSGQHR